jgi:hypothetical protein
MRKIGLCNIVLVTICLGALAGLGEALQRWGVAAAELPGRDRYRLEAKLKALGAP